MDKVKLPMGSSRTKWINDAIREKLDRDNPESVHPMEGVQPVQRMEIVKPVQPVEIVKPVKPVEIVKHMEGDDFWGDAERMRELVKRHAR
jgi:hypothetical protein